jgi:hypothetical protein
MTAEGKSVPSVAKIEQVAQRKLIRGALLIQYFSYSQNRSAKHTLCTRYPETIAIANFNAIEK